MEEGHAVEVAADGAAALNAVADGPAYDLVVLDVMLPKPDGFTVLQTLRERRVQTLGVPRARAGPAAPEPWPRRAGAAAGDLCLDPVPRVVMRGRRSISLTAREYALLEYFPRNAGRVLTRPMITQHVWGVTEATSRVTTLAFLHAVARR